MVVYMREGVVRESVVRVKIESASPKAEEQRARAREDQQGTNRPGRGGLSMMACDAQFQWHMLAGRGEAVGELTAWCG